ncbi:TRAP ABC transporter [Desulfonema ishimotonii]|uniref:TRAP ABC transporter n=1 Tax=Desulfonema ishimotonii TaxID=45657 RepID=A0A401FRB0_9BACT|nr:TRAP transporter substrate-binding protein DctP [Desulfonema ishimotonii]GBC59493.1 TRAP ABC transporter [Desulfonema ishimotonii]
MTEHRLKEISRRDLLRLARTFGRTSTVLAAAAMTGAVTLPRLAAAAEETSRKRLKKKARVNLTYVVPVLGDAPFRIGKFGTPEFIRDIEERTDGEIRVELITGMDVCNQLDCVKRVQEGTVDIYHSSTQNAAGVAPYFNALDFPYLFPGRAAQNHFFYHPMSEKLFREPLRKHHGICFLFTSCRLRSLMMGKKWQDRPDVRRIDELIGAKIRVTASKPGKIALKLLKTHPIPVPWNETPNALKFGLIDGMESWESAIAAAMPHVLSQVIDIRLFSGNGHTAMNAAVFDKMPAELQNAVMESSYHAQMFAHLASEAALINIVGASDPQKPGTIFAKHQVRFVQLPDEELKKAEQMCSPEFNPAPWERWRERLNEMAGGIDVYREIHKIAREIPADTLAEDVQPRRWWKGA